MNQRHPLGIAAATILWIVAVVFAVRGEMEARRLEAKMEAKRAGFPARIAEIKVHCNNRASPATDR